MRQHLKNLIFFVFALSTLGWGCTDDYFSDGGILTDDAGNLNKTTLDFLKSQPEKFDTLARLLQICGLEAQVNQSGNTFLAPQDYSIHNYFKLEYPEGVWPPLAALPQDQIEKITRILRNYIIPDKEILRRNLSTAYSFEATLDGKKARFNLVKDDYLGNVNMGAATLVFSLDISDTEDDREVFQSVNVVSSDLKSTNGTVHVLEADAHIFGFN